MGSEENKQEPDNNEKEEEEGAEEDWVTEDYGEVEEYEWLLVDDKWVKQPIT